MKYLFLLTLSFLFLQSCTIKEQLTVSESGMIDHQTEIDLTEMMGLMYTESVIDSLSRIGEFPVDTVFSYEEAEKYFQTKGEELGEIEKEFFQTLDKSYVQYQANEKKVTMRFITNQMNVKDFNQYWNKIDQKISELEKKDPQAATKVSSGSQFTSLNVLYDGKTFQRISKSNQSELFKDENDLFGGAEMMKMLTYKMEYKFPKPIKKSSIENATYSLDRKTMMVEVPLEELVNNPDVYNFTVEFE